MVMKYSSAMVFGDSLTYEVLSINLRADTLIFPISLIISVKIDIEIKQKF